MKIAFIAATALPIPATKGGATETLVSLLINRNSIKKKHDFIVYSNWERRAYEESLNIENCSFIFYKSTFIRSLFDKVTLFFSRVLRRITNGKTSLKYGFVKHAYKSIKKEKPDIVIFEGNTMHVRQACPHIDCLKILHVHADILNDEKPIDGHSIAEDVDYIIAVSEYAKSRIKTLVKDDKKILVLKNVIDSKKFDSRKYSKLEQNALRSKFKIREDDFVLVYCGRVVEQKGVLDLVKAMALLPNKIKLIVVGSSWFGKNEETPFIRDLKRESQKLGDRIMFTGYINQSDLPIYYSISDLAIFPSKYNETAGLVVLEALSCGTPVVSPNFGGMFEFSPKESTYTIDTTNNCSNNIVQIIKHILNHQEEYYLKKAKARESVESFNPNKYYDDFCALINEVSKR